MGLGDGSIVYKPITSLTSSCKVSSHAHSLFPCSAGGKEFLDGGRQRAEELCSSSSSSSLFVRSSEQNERDRATGETSALLCLNQMVLGRLKEEEKEEREREEVGEGCPPKEKKRLSRETVPSQQSTTITSIHCTDTGDFYPATDEEEEEETTEEEKSRGEVDVIGAEGYSSSGVCTPEHHGGFHQDYQSRRKGCERPQGRGGGGGHVFPSLTLDRFYQRNLQEERKTVKDNQALGFSGPKSGAVSSSSSSPGVRDTSQEQAPRQQSDPPCPSSSMSGPSAPVRPAGSSSSSSEEEAADCATYRRVRLQLLSLQYHERFDRVNTRLVDRLLRDVVKAVENFQILMKRSVHRGRKK